MVVPNGHVLDLEQLSLLLRTAQRGRSVIGLDGPGGAGKTTLAEHLAPLLGAVVVHTDDFYRPADQRPSGNFPVGGQYDLARLRTQVVAPAVSGRPIRYQRYDWYGDALADWIAIPPNMNVIVEGIYSTERSIRDLYTWRIFCTASFDIRLSRGLARDGEAARSQWVDEWMPAEERYFQAQRPDSSAEFVMDGSGAAHDRLSFTLIGGTAAQQLPGRTAAS